MPDNAKVVHLGQHTNDGTKTTPVQALEQAIEEIETRERRAFNSRTKKLLILALDDTEGNFEVSFIQAGMKMSECMAVCEAGKMLFLAQMGYLGPFEVE